MHDSLTNKEITAVLDCLNSGQYTQGKIVEDFEAQFSKWNGSKYAVMVNSGSSANLLMIQILKKKYNLNDRDEVLVPAVTWPTTIYPIIQNNLSPLVCDVDDTFNISVESMERMITKNTKALFLVHLLGQPANLREIKIFCKKHGLIIIEDSCESMGAKYNGLKVGNFGVMSSFSLYFGHHMTTIEGGIITTDNFEIYELLKSARSHGWVRNSSRSEKYKNEFVDTNFVFDMLGYNLRSTNLNAAIGLVQLKKLNGFIKIRKKNHHDFLTQISKIPGLKIQKIDLKETSSFSLAILFDTKEKRDYMLKELPKRGIECRLIVAGNLLRQPVFKTSNKKLKADLCSKADEIHDFGLYLPNNQFIRHKEIQYMVDNINDLLNQFQKNENKGLDLSIILPTFNERKNIKILIPKIMEFFSNKDVNFEIIVVDDNSPDGTQEEVNFFKTKFKNIKLINRKRKEGIGAALNEGYNSASGKLIMSSDTDLSFKVEEMGTLYDKINQGYDLVVGSRYAKGGFYEKKNIRTLSKGAISYVGNKLWALMFHLPVSDFSANFRVIRKDVWDKINTTEKNNFLLFEMIFKTSLISKKITEIPVSFRDRIYGHSKLKLYIEAPKAVSKLLKYWFKWKLLRLR